MEITGKAKFISTSPRKLRLIAAAVRHMPIAKATSQLSSLPQNGAKTVLRVLKQAMGNAQNNFKLSPDDLIIDTITVDEGPRFKRRDVHAHGARFDSGLRRKRMSHITVTLKQIKH